jgi:hypothetical protein
MNGMSVVDNTLSLTGQDLKSMEETALRRLRARSEQALHVAMWHSIWVLNFRSLALAGMNESHTLGLQLLP